MATENEDWLTFWCVLSCFDLITGFFWGEGIVCLLIIISLIQKLFCLKEVKIRTVFSDRGQPH